MVGLIVARVHRPIAALLGIPCYGNSKIRPSGVRCRYVRA
jgi:hypothetical protein